MERKKIKNKIAVTAVTFSFLLNTVCFAQGLLPAGISPNVKPNDPAVTDPFKERISVDYKDVDVADILRSLSYTYGLNLVTSTEVKGKITISLKDVFLSEALEAILSSNGYNYSRKGSILYVTPGSVEGAQVITEAITLKYIKAADAQNLVRRVLSSKGDIKVDEISNMLVVTDYPASIEKLKGLLKDVDQPPRQVLIEAKIIDITSKDLQNLGVTWQVDYSPSKGIFGRDTHASERTKITQTTAGTSSSLSGGQFKLDTLVLKGLTANATIDALVQQQKAHLLASPSIAVLNNREARIIIGEKVPYLERTQTTTGTTETTKFIDVGTTLRVTPSINADGYITLAIHPEVSSVNSLLSAGPRITTREADTVVRVKEGETIVIGGLIKQEDNRTRSRVPVLGYIPLLGLLFSNKSSDKTQTELAVFITPKILLSRAEMLAENKTRYEEEAYVNIMGTAGLNVQMKLLEKAKRLQSGAGLESSYKESWQRKNQALSIYESIFTQFPDGPKAAESGFQAAVLYNELGEYYLAKEMCSKVISKYPDSDFVSRAENLQKVINASLRKDAREKAEKELTKIRALSKEEEFQEARRKQDVAFQAHLQEELERDKKEAARRSQLQEEKAREIKERQEAKAKLEEARQKDILEAAMINAYKAEEVRQAKEEARKKAAAEAAEKARLKAEESRKRLEEITRQKEEAPKKLAELARQKEEARKKSDAEAALKKEAKLKAVEEVKLAKEAARQKAAAEAAEKTRQREEVRKKSDAEADLKKAAKLKAAEEARQAKEEARKKAAAEAAELARQKADARQKVDAEAALKKAAKLQAAEEAKATKEEARKKAAAEAAELARQKEEARQKADTEAALKKEAKLKAAEEARQAKEEVRKKAAAEAAEKARLKAEESRKRLEEIARQKEEARQKSDAEADLKKAAKLKAAEEARQAKEEARKKAAAEVAEKARQKEEARKKAEEKARLVKEAARQAREKARLEEELRKKAEEKKRLEKKAAEKIKEAERLKEEARKKSIEAEIYQDILREQ